MSSVSEDFLLEIFHQLLPLCEPRISHKFRLARARIRGLGAPCIASFLFTVHLLPEGVPRIMLPGNGAPTCIMPLNSLLASNTPAREFNLAAGLFRHHRPRSESTTRTCIIRLAVTRCTRLKAHGQ